MYTVHTVMAYACCDSVPQWHCGPQFDNTLPKDPLADAITCSTCVILCKANEPLVTDHLLAASVPHSVAVW
jgi:hypothetical protein